MIRRTTLLHFKTSCCKEKLLLLHGVLSVVYINLLESNNLMQSFASWLILYAVACSTLPVTWRKDLFFTI